MARKDTYRVISPAGLVRATGRTREEAEALAAACGGKAVVEPAPEPPAVPRTAHGPRYPESDCTRGSRP